MTPRTETIAATTLCVAMFLWWASAWFRDLNARREEMRRRKDRASWLAFMAHEQRRQQRQADAANLAVADAFRAAMDQPQTQQRIDRIRAQIAANEARRFEREALADIEALTSGGAA